ncbi:DNA-binding transcriptional ArsR family regulator [Nakamurella sp. UYEF19]|uniref:ArsR/SmtB family transcription factor n=1 Tax=Nakamurella sp. UYEF19 TaxID=1756392 RepID=UPI00339B5B37
MNSINTSGLPDYDLADRMVVTAPSQLKAMAEPLRDTLLELVLERAATVQELAAAVHRPKSSIAHHVHVLVDAGLMRVVRTRRVRAIEERFYGRTARIFQVGRVRPEDVSPPPWPNDLATSAQESHAAYLADRMRSLRRHVRISPGRAAEFWERVAALVDDFSQLPRDGEEMYALVTSLYPAEHPTLAEPAPEG